MGEFARLLRTQVADVHAAVHGAWSTGDEDGAVAGAHRLTELLGLAARHGVDVSGWLDPAVRALVATTQAW